MCCMYLWCVFVNDFNSPSQKVCEPLHTKSRNRSACTLFLPAILSHNQSLYSCQLYILTISLIRNIIEYVCTCMSSLGMLICCVSSMHLFTPSNVCIPQRILRTYG